MNPVTKKKYYTHEEYLALEEKAEYKSEYHDGEIVPLFREIVDGEVVAMAGGSPNHSKISLSIGAELRTSLKGTTCQAYNSDLKIPTIIQMHSVFFSCAFGRLCVIFVIHNF